jgi:hypothetical protein
LDTTLEWTKKALRILDKAPDRVAVLKEFSSRFIPMSCTGSRVAVIERQAKLLDSLEESSDGAVAAAATQEKVRLRDAIEEEQRMEAITDRERDERFEW